MSTDSKYPFACAIYPREADAPPDSEQQSDAADSGRLALKPSVYWTPGYEIHVRFLPNSKDSGLSDDRFQAAIDEIKVITREWTDAANIYFAFDDARDAPVRIQLYSGAGGVSALGTTCRQITDPDEPTMRLGKSDDKSLFRSSVLHEFGHVLGCVHEHSSPRGRIRWNKEVVLKHYKDAHKWSPERVEKEVFRAYDEGEVDCSDFDRDSVMIYPIEPAFTMDRMRAPLNTCLSERDKQFIANIYPREIDEEAGAFYSWNYKSWRRHDPKNKAFVRFPKPSPTGTIPTIAVGLVQADVSNVAALCLRASSHAIKKAGFIAQTETWDDSQLASAGVMWLKLGPDLQADGFQSGKVDSRDTHNDRVSLPPHTKIDVRFPRPFAAPPDVVLWISGFHIGHQRKVPGDVDWSLEVSAHETSKEGFQLHINREENSLLHRAIVTWVAFPADTPGVFSGVECGTREDVEDWPGRRDNRNGFSRRVDLSSRKGAQRCTAPNFRVYSGIASLHFKGNTSLRLHIETKKCDDSDNREVRENVFWLHVGTWNDSMMLKASASWLVIHT